ncbi:MAG: hypothetical protein ACYDEV_12345 [Acidiferrobacter sp.]
MSAVLKSPVLKALQDFDFDTSGRESVGMSETEIKTLAKKTKTISQETTQWLRDNDPAVKARALVRKARKARLQEAA